MKILILTMTTLFLFSSYLYSETETSYHRLDPHGSPTIDLRKTPFDKNTECKTCHRSKPTTEKSLEELKKWSNQTCQTCHGKLPHGGILEHQAKKVSCLDCHRPHRAPLNDREKKASSLLQQKLLFFHVLRDQPLPSGLENRPGSSQMFRKRCVDCHQW